MRIGWGGTYARDILVRVYGSDPTLEMSRARAGVCVWDTIIDGLMA